MNIDWANNESSFLIEITKQGFRTFLGKTFDIRIPLLKTLNQLPPLSLIHISEPTRPY